MSGRLYILSGASGCGKTTLLNQICKEPFASQFGTVYAPKYSERASRGAGDDVTHVDRIDSEGFDHAYVINNYRYAIRSSEVLELASKGLNPVVIVSDFRIVRELKQRAPELVCAIYVSSAIDADQLRRIQLERYGFRPDQTQKEILSTHFARVSAAARLGWWDRVSECVTGLYKDWRAYATDAESTEIRAQRIRAFHTRYIEHVALFDHVILNYSENRPEDMAVQLSNIIRRGSHISTPRRPPLFIVAAASGAGKGSLMETLNLIGGDRIRVLTKYAQRDEKKNDKRDGTVAIGRHGTFPDAFDVRWRFHGTEGHGGTAYAISSSEVDSNIAAGLPQIVVSNMQAFPSLRERWPMQAVFVYLHRLVSLDEVRRFQLSNHSDDPVQAEARTAEITQVYEDYIAQIADFDHVLLNTSYLEDLFDQMFRLIDAHAIEVQGVRMVS